MLDVLFQHTTLQPHWGSWHSFFSKFNACAVLIYCFRFLAWTFNHKMSSLFLDVFVLFWGGEPAGKLQVNDFLLRNVVIKNGLLAHALLTLCSRFSRSRFAHVLLTLCSRFAHVLLTLCSRFAQLCSRSPRFLLSPLGSFWVLTRFLLGPYEDLLTICSRFARGLLTVCSRFARRCSRFAHALGDDVSILMKKPISKPCHFFVVPSHVYLRHTAFRLQTPWGWFSNLKKQHPHATHNPSLKRGCHTPASAWDMYVQRSFWAQRTQKVYPILWYYDMFLCSPKGPKSTSIDGIVQRSF